MCLRKVRSARIKGTYTKKAIKWMKECFRKPMRKHWKCTNKATGRRDKYMRRINSKYEAMINERNKAMLKRVAI